MTLTINQNETKKEKRSRFTEDTFYIIWEFMRTELKLEKCELLIYAVIFNLYRSGNDFRGSNQYLADYTGYKRSQICNALKSLTNKGYIIADFESSPYGQRPVFSINPRALPIRDMFRIENLSVKYADELDKIRAAENNPTA